MPRNPEFPLLIRDQGVTVKIYRISAPSTRSGTAYKVSWIGSEGSANRSITDLAEAREFARTKAAQLAAGVVSGLQLSRADWLELSELRRLAAEANISPLTAMTEWLQAHRVAGADILEACRSHAANRSRGLKRITVSTAIDLFIKAKDDAGKSGNRVYGSKLKPLRSELGDRSLDLLTVQDWSRFLSRFEDPVTRNDIRKRAVTLCRWAQRQGHLSDEAKPEVEKTERAKERANPIGILTPEEFRSLLDFFRQKHPRHLAALVIAGFCGVRAEEIHGKRGDPGRRQLWKDIHLDRGFLSVTAAKENTPSSRIVHLSNAAVAWLRLCQQDEGPVCQSHAIDRIRDIAATNGMPIPPNALRHSYITYRIAMTGDKASTATEAGNSVKEIDRRYRVPRPKADGEAWFAIMPAGISASGTPAVRANLRG